MAYVLTAEREAEDYLTSNSWQRYMDYLESHRCTFPTSAFALATSTWWYSFEDPKAPHDSRLERVEFGDMMNYEKEDGVYCWLRIHLSSAYSGHITLFYPRVYAYSLGMIEEDQSIHGDWRYDEFSYSGMKGRFTHTIEWADGPTWRITASDLIHEYKP